MGEELKTLLAGSAAAKKISLDSRIVVQRTRLSPNELAALQREGSYGSVPREEEICELKVGGQVLARGRILKRRGKYFFKIREILESEGEDR